MISKGTHIPEERLKLAADACTAARASFNEWADVPAGKFPVDAVDAMQVQLMRWQRDRFGHVDSSDPVIALGVIEELGETFDDDVDAEGAVDGLGDTMIYGAQLCTSNRLAIRHVIDLARIYVHTNLPSPISIAGRFAHVVGKHAQRTRGLDDREAFQLCLVDALAMMIAKALEDCSLGHELTIEPAGVFLVIGREVCERKVGDVMIPAGTTIVTHGYPIETPLSGLVLADPGVTKDQVVRAMERLGEGVALLEEAERVEGPGDFDVSDQKIPATAPSVTAPK